jgi:N-acetylglucosamine-6-phosphate deacetylase
MKTIICNAEVINPNQRGRIAAVVIEEGKITGVHKDYKKGITHDHIVEANGMYLCPGFIDVHFHGAMAADTMDADATSLHRMSKYCSEHGVTSFYPTTWAAPNKEIQEVLQAVKNLPRHLPGARILGVHLEGPYLSSKFRGAQQEQLLSYPNKEDYFAWFETGVVKLVTCAPELPGATNFIKEAVRQDIRVSIGHSGAAYEQVLKAADMGITQATHLFNGMGGMHHREPGTVGGILDDRRIFVQVICDGIHLHPAVIRLTCSVKTNEKIILITDSIVGAGLVDGVYNNNGNKIVITNEIARTELGSLAGSTLTMDRAIRNMVAFTGYSLEKVIPMATSTPAAAMGIADRKGRIAPGYDADLVILDKDLNIDQTFVGGRSVFIRL